MPVNECQLDGEPGVKWGDAGTCYTYDPDNEQSRKDAVKKALAQGIAIGDIDIERGISLADLETRDVPAYDGPGLVVLIGPPGAGKTSWLDKNLPNAERVDLEQIRREPDADRNQIITNAIDKTFELLRAGSMVAFDSTAIKPEFRSRLRGIAREVDVPVHAVVFDTPLDDLLAAQASRKYPVPDSRVRELYEDFQSQLPTIYSEDWSSVQTVSRTEDRSTYHRAVGDVDLTPTEAMGAAARKGLELYEEGKGGDGLVPATIRDARKMANGEALSEQKVRRMPAWWARHRDDWTESDTEPGDETPGYVAALLWGIDSKDGSPGATWAERKVRELDRASEQEDRRLERRDDAYWMTPRQVAIYEALEEIAETFGAFDKSTGANGVHYIPASDNDWADEGLACQGCAFYYGGGGCEILAAGDEVEPEGVCKYWIVRDPNATPMPIPTEEEDEGEDDEENTNPMDMISDDTPELERSHSPVPVEYRDSGLGSNYKTISGYAAVFGKMSEDLGGFREIIAPGAFSRALERGDTIKLLYDHDSAAVLASSDNGSLEIREDEVGLHVWARVDMDDPDVQRVAAKLRSGIVDQMSFAFTMGDDAEDDWEYTSGLPVRTIRSVSTLIEASIVAFPAYTSTKVALLERARHAGRLPLVGATDVAPETVGGMPTDDTRGADPRRSAYWRAKLTQRKQETRKWTS